MNSLNERRSLRIALVHPDLGIGGAERLVVDVAKVLQQRGHRVIIYTTHHSHAHCFEETKKQIPVQVHGDFLPRHIFGLFHVFFAAMRCLWLALYLYFFTPHQYDLMFVDQVPFTVPILRRCATRILFYCHFPDKYLAPRSANPLRRLYRLFFDQLEEKTMQRADRIVVNSTFTARHFMQAFPSTKTIPSVLYPGVYIPPLLDTHHGDKYSIVLDEFFRDSFVVVSLNRFEAKKNLPLALTSFNWLLQNSNPVDNKTSQRPRLVIAGGFDVRVAENARVFSSLCAQCDRLGLTFTVISPSDINNADDHHIDRLKSSLDCKVLFLPSVPDRPRDRLLTQAACLIYTPHDEHLGLVPLEAMARATPVIAINSGGPRETVIDGVTGFLCEAAPKHIGERLKSLYRGQVNERQMGESAREHVLKSFSMEIFGDRLEGIIYEMLGSIGVNSVGSKH